MTSRLRWLVIAVFALSTAINYLDRSTFAQLAGPIGDEFRWTNTQYGLMVTVFQIPYTLAAPLAGMLIDTLGLRLATSLFIGLWSLAGIATAFAAGPISLAACRAVLGAAEAGGIPAVAKAIHQYLKPAERGLGNAINQIGVSLGIILATPIATGVALRAGWRAAFLVTGSLGLLWIPLLNWTAAAVPAAPVPPPEAGDRAALVRDPSLWAMVAANMLSMVGYSLWTNWTAKYLMSVHHLTLGQVARYTWIPPLCSLLGGLGGGWFSLRLVEIGFVPLLARYRVCLVMAALSLATALLPFAPAPAWSAAGISLSFAAVAAFSVNLYTMPLDAFGAARTAFAVSFLTAAAGAIAALSSIPIGAVVDRWGYAPVTTAVALTPLAACVVLRRALK